MEEIWQTVVDYLDENLRSLVRAGATLILGLLLARLVSGWLERLLTRHTGKQQALLARRLVFYVMSGVVVVSTLAELGIDMTVLLGAAGVLTVAVGFASQTSASNLISGLFLLGERAFVIDDFIRVGTTMGRVVGIDMLSIKLQTFDNLLVRIPNEMLLKSEFTNLTHFPIRRLDIIVGLAYDTPVPRAIEVLLSVAEAHPHCLDEPQPLVHFLDFADSSLQLRLSTWTSTEHFWELGRLLRADIKAALDAAGLEIPFPQRTLHLATAAATVSVAERPAATGP